MDGGLNGRVQVKQELLQQARTKQPTVKSSQPVNIIDLSSTSSDSLSDSDDLSSASLGDDHDEPTSLKNKRPRVSIEEQGGSSKKKKIKDFHSVLPVDFLDPLPRKDAAIPLVITGQENGNADMTSEVQGCKQFWKAGDYGGTKSVNWNSTAGGLDHVRVHPKFLHSNATSHKWVLGAFAELLDNSLDEVTNGATFVKVDMIINKKDNSRMLLIEDNGGGMDPEKVRHCMSLGYSHKSKNANTIGQYGNGFKTSTMRLGADVIVFSRCSVEDGKMPTQSIGLLSYTFLKSTGQEDIVVPLLDYKKGVKEWDRMIRSSTTDWHKNLETIIQWSPFANEEDLLHQFRGMKDHGTCIIIYNLWEDDQGMLELDFDADPHDIQIRGVNRDEKNIQMGKLFPNSKHFLTYQHSLRSYASILYLRVPPAFRIILRGRDVAHHNIVNDLMMTQEVTYRPNPGADGVQKDSNMVAIVTIGFVKDAKAHIDVQGFNVYHKNRLIKPFWRLWNPAGSGGRGVIGVLEANFVEPAHDKQGFERTIVLSRLEARLIHMQKTFWNANCHKIGYASNHNKDNDDGGDNTPDHTPGMTSRPKKASKNSEARGKTDANDKGKALMLNNGGNDASKNSEARGKTDANDKGKALMLNNGGNDVPNQHWKARKDLALLRPPSPLSSQCDADNDDIRHMNDNALIIQLPVATAPLRTDSSPTIGSTPSLGSRGTEDSESNFIPTPVINCKQENGDLAQMREENRQLKERLKTMEDEILDDLVRDLQLEKNKRKDLEAKLKESTMKIEEMKKEQETLIEIFSEEREKRDIDEEKLRKKLMDASNTIQDLLNKFKRLEEEQVTKRGDPRNRSRK